MLPAGHTAPKAKALFPPAAAPASTTQVNSNRWGPPWPHHTHKEVVGDGGAWLVAVNNTPTPDPNTHRGSNKSGLPTSQECSSSCPGRPASHHMLYGCRGPACGPGLLPALNNPHLCCMGGVALVGWHWSTQNTPGHTWAPPPGFDSWQALPCRHGSSAAATAAACKVPCCTHCEKEQQAKVDKLYLAMQDTHPHHSSCLAPVLHKALIACRGAWTTGQTTGLLDVCCCMAKWPPLVPSAALHHNHNQPKLT